MSWFVTQFIKTKQYIYIQYLSKTKNNVQENVKKIFTSALERPSHCRQSPQNMATRPHRIYVTGIFTRYNKELKQIEIEIQVQKEVQKNI